jgi:hypothetical protein
MWEAVVVAVRPAVLDSNAFRSANASRCPLWVDAVEKVGSALPERNNGIKTNNILNRCCVFASSLESMLLGKAPKIFFQQYRSKAEMLVTSQ